MEESARRKFVTIGIALRERFVFFWPYFLNKVWVVWLFYVNMVWRWGWNKIE